jgi:hypothetical protein
MDTYNAAVFHARAICLECGKVGCDSYCRNARNVAIAARDQYAQMAIDCRNHGENDAAIRYTNEARYAEAMRLRVTALTN